MRTSRTVQGAFLCLIAALLLGACGGGGGGGGGGVTERPSEANGIDGTTGVDGTNGVDGRNGSDGKNGSDGLNGKDGSNGSDGFSALSTVSAAGVANCPQGGSKIETGLDKNGDGQLLGDDEVTSTQYVCGEATPYKGGSGRTVTWSKVTEAIDAEPNAGYIASNDFEQAVITLPPNAKASPGEVFRVVGSGAAGWKVAQNEGQQIWGLSPDWRQATADDQVRKWVSVASSADGSKLVAVGRSVSIDSTDGRVIDEAGSEIFISTDSGATWTPRSDTPQFPGTKNWTSVASSADGSVLVAAAVVNVFISTNGGNSWTTTDDGAGTLWRSVASSADGGTLAVAGRDAIQVRIGQRKWTRITTDIRDWAAVALSADGTKLVAAETFNKIHVATRNENGIWSWRLALDRTHGDIWSPVVAWASVASSADGRTLLAGEVDGSVYLSTDGGMNWAPVLGDIAQKKRWSVASSADGRRLVAAASKAENCPGDWFGGGQFFPTGPTFHSISWNLPDHVYTSADGGKTWSAEGPARAWTAVASSADGDKIVAAGTVLGPARKRPETIVLMPVGTEIAGLVMACFDSGRHTYQNFPDHTWISSTWTTLGTAGSISGDRLDAVELQYIDDGVFKVISQEGDLTVE